MTGQVFWFTGSGYPSVGIYNSVTIPANSYTDSLIDTPTNYEAESGNNGGNYCTLNPLSGVGGSTLANGNLDFSGGSGDPIWRVGTIGMSSGKWYWEYTVGSVVINNYVGIFNNQNILSGYVLHGQSDFTTAGGTNSFSNNTFTTGDVFGVAVDIAAGSMQVFKNGSSIGSSTGNTLSTGTWFPVISVNVAPTTAWSLNFGQRPFAYTPPTGHLSLCTTNLPDPTIADGSTAFDVKLRNGSPSSTISGYGFSPDLLWEKARSKSGSHYLMDSVRGSTNTLSSDSTSAESSQPNYITGFTSDGFTTGTNDFTSGVSLVGWAWDGGSSTVSNTDGSITSNVRARPDTGFSIISYIGNGTAGATIGHGLNAVPGLLIVKNRSTSVTSPAWGVKHSGLYSNSGYWLKLENSDAAVVEGPGSGSLFNATNPGSSVFTVGPRNTTNTNGDNYIAYCWAPVEGFSSFGSYQGNGSSDGPFVYTGHRVKWLLLKRTDSTGDWFVLDSERNLFNPTDSYLRPNLANSELDNTEFVDLLSNGFKIKATGNAYNGSGATVIYAAYAEHPFASNARAR